ncbi:MAG: ATP-binding protein [Ignavibacterium sp.]|nr:ATP-binding protein [Ignavibacterium sp.]
MRVQVRFFTFLLIQILFLSYQTFSQTHIPTGNVNGKWFKQNSPYYIDGEIKIPRGKKLVIEPGVKVIFIGHYKLIVNGILEAKGTEQDSIYFFPRDTSIGWHGIRFIEAEDFSTLEYCVLNYGKTATGRELEEIIDCQSKENYDDCPKLFDADGGAILINKSHPRINHCLIENNFAALSGGGIAIVNNSNPVINYCQIRNNIANQNGGGIQCISKSDPTIENCIIERNSAFDLGGGINVQNYCDLLINNCIINNNKTGLRGGGICFYTNLKPIVKNSVISGNTAPLGGAIYIDEFYNEFREQVGKIDIRIINVSIENNLAEYGGGIWIRDSMGELKGVTVCNNRAMIGGGVHIEHNPMYFKFSSEYLCNVYMNFARIMGNDFFRLGGGKFMMIPLDTFTVKYYSALNAEPIEKFVLGIKNFKLTQVNADLYVSPNGNDTNSGLSDSEPLKTLKIAFLKILADSTSPRTVFMDEGEYFFTETNDVLMLDKHKYVSLKGAGFTEVIFGKDRISVFTPWWITTWALIIYSSVIIGIIVLMVNVRTRRFKIKSELDKKEFEAQKLHEVDELKSQFFTNISHEFRTPLTLILGPVKQMIERTKDHRFKDDLSMVHRNAFRLLELVNQLLDISKLESGSMKLQTVPQNIIPLLKALVLSFSSYAERKKITLQFNCDVDEIIVYLDKDKFEKIINNILSNAFKFTPSGGKIEVTASLKPSSFPPFIKGELKGGSIQTMIADTGIGIPKDKLSKIFDRFYQVNSSHTREQEGTGIGLALTKELIDLHKGKINVESEEGRGTIVTVNIPIGKDHLKPDEIIEQVEKQEHNKPKSFEHLIQVEGISEDTKIILKEIGDDSLPLLLIVEDNTDVRKYIKDNLNSGFRIIEAKDGEDGWNKSVENIPDLIISDVMMPKMDGFKLCEKLKTDERTSHIPVILLTAKAAKQDKLDGYELGADEYIMKPFETDELKARIKNLIQQRERIHQHFKEHGLIELNLAKINATDKKFLQSIYELVINNISKQNFTVEQLAEMINISRSVMHKKIVSLIGETPGELIRRVRINKAAELIEKRFGNLSEIALEVGFNNPAYFSEAFKKQFGVTPSQYQHKFSNS